MRKKKLYVVGYDGDIQCVYGKNKKNEFGVEIVQWCNPMTAFAAKRKHKNMPSKGAVIYKLVKVDPKKI